ncbi:cytochrome C-552 [Paracoccus zhejiangensis]|uniref:cytochrome C-552 n=1 Tax=Paracoccus zhejiangensis TaxID=1077935 RepID=UPI0018E4D552|nr:cytochrome C-552 [Paracoccus zhejiangensis]
MHQIQLKLALGLAALLGSAALAVAQSGPDPMRALRNEVQISAADPMAALRAPAATETEGPAPNPEFGNLPDAPGAEETYYQCTACHSTAIILQQRVTDARWDDLWQWMVEKQGMFDPEPAEKEVIMTYLKTHFSSER